jgi:hypothetical protein
MSATGNTGFFSGLTDALTPDTPEQKFEKAKVAAEKEPGNVDLKIAVIDAQCELEKAQIDEKCKQQKEDAKNGKSNSGTATFGGRRRKHTKKHKKSKSRRGRTGRKSSRL